MKYVIRTSQVDAKGLTGVLHELTSAPHPIDFLLPGSGLDGADTPKSVQPRWLHFVDEQMRKAGHKGVKRDSCPSGIAPAKHELSRYVGLIEARRPAKCFGYIRRVQMSRHLAEHDACDIWHVVYGAEFQKGQLCSLVPVGRGGGHDTIVLDAGSLVEDIGTRIRDFNGVQAFISGGTSEHVAENGTITSAGRRSYRAKCNHL